MKHSVIHRLAPIALASALQACGSDSDDPPIAPPPPPPAPPSVELVQVFADVPAFTQPVAMLQAPGDASRWYVVERAGIVHVFDNDADADTRSTFVDISATVESGPGEAGLLGMAFHPDFANNGTVFLSYTSGAPLALISHISRFVSNDGGLTLDAGSEQSVLTVPQDFDNHNGGNIAFGPDGFLYIGFGDGGDSNDPLDRAQDTTDVLGAMLRIDVDGGAPYEIPPDNPFAGNPTCLQGFGLVDCPEIYAWGLRNPWRWSFDAVTGDLWVGDVGQGMWEEIDLVELGGNYGWRIREGAHCNIPDNCDSTGLIDPVVEYDHNDGQSVTGGYVYRGQAMPDFDGVYIYADFLSGRIWGLFDDGAGGREALDLADTSAGISSFAQSEDLELYVVDFNVGLIYQVVAGD